MARREARKFPGVKVAPQPLVDYSVSDAPGTEISYFGYEFEVPWNGISRQKAGNGIVQLEFESGQSVTFIVPTNQSGLLTELVQDPSMHMENWRPVFGDLMNRSAYDQQAALLYTTPQSVRAFGPRAEAVRGMTLLTIKAIATPSSLGTGVFSFELPDKRGFQIGDPHKSTRVDLEVFGMGGHHVEIICATLKDNIKLSQSELKRMLTSLHPVLAEPSAVPSPSITDRQKSVSGPH
ncbi:MAG: hypothetical protein ACLQMT_09700 [Candidatus Acidiferrales bacterium]